MNSARFYVFLHVSLFNFKAKIKGDFFYRMILLEVFEFFLQISKKGRNICAWRVFFDGQILIF